MRAALAPGARAVERAAPPAVLVFGVWLALDVDGYGCWDGWIIAAFVLWLAASAPAGALSAARAPATTASTRALSSVAVMTLATTLLLLDMIFKPGA